MLKSEAETQIINEWSRHITENPISNPTTRDGFSFYNHLEKNRPDLLRFRCRGDQWQVIKGWLLQRRLVTDKLEPKN